jgi:hypothetical protein
MSSLSPPQFDDTPPPGSYQKWMKIIHASPRVLDYQQKLLRRPISHSYDMPYVAGYNMKGTQIYIDRHLPFMDKIDGKQVCVRDYLAIHEATEKALLTLWEHKYEAAHHIATAVEYKAVQDAGIKVLAYKKFFEPYIKQDAHEKLEKIPADLDLTPMADDYKLLKHLRPLMEKDRKTAKRIFAPEGRAR